VTPSLPRPQPAPDRDDAAARQRIRTSLSESLIVEAAAGTGKTHELVQRMVRVLAAGARIEGVVAVTFTHKAAGELKLRLRQELDTARLLPCEDAERANLEDALERLEEASIGTIHSFCAQILRERPVEAVVDPAFEELAEAGASRILGAAFEAWFSRQLGQGSAALRRALTRLADPYAQRFGTPLEQLQRAARSLAEWRDYPTAWRSDPSFDRAAEIDALLAECRLLDGLLRRARSQADALVGSMRPLRDLLARADRAEELGLRDLDELEAELVRLAPALRYYRKGYGKFAPDLPREHVTGAVERLLADLDLFADRSGADLAAALRAELVEVVGAYTDLKHRAGKLDFLDLLERVRNLVRDNAQVRAELQARFTHIFVDEFQDTDPLQMQILLLLASADAAESNWLKARPAPGKLFVVGDPKQSIYKFRRADVMLYDEVCQALEAHGVARIHLTRSRRAVRPLQECVNHAFSRVISYDAAAGQPDYVPLEEYRPPIAGQPSVVVIPAPEPYNVRNVTKSRIDACLPDALVAFVDWLLNRSGWKVSDPENPAELVPIAPGHVCLLFRRFLNNGDDMSRDYSRSLEARSIPHMLVGSKSFHKREEIETLRTALTTIEWPDDELAVYATLHGSLFAFDDATLFRYRTEAGSLDPFRPRPADLATELTPVAEVLDLLAQLHRGRNRRPIAATFNDLLEAARAHAGFAFRPGGDQVLANVYRLSDLARSFEYSGGLSFRGFVEELAEQAARADASEPPVMEDSAAGVRLMTVHNAKGLEFPVVVLCDMTTNLAARNPERTIDSDRGVCAMRLIGCDPLELVEQRDAEHRREQAEGIRVAYVAATRARDLLVIPAIGDGPFDGWLGPLNAAIYPHQRRCQPAPAPASAPPFGDRTVLKRPQDLDREPENSVRPGLHHPGPGTYGVVWWDPAALALGVEENFGARQKEILGGTPADAAPQLAEYAQWQERRTSANQQGARPQCRPVAVTQAGACQHSAVREIAVDLVAVPGRYDRSRPSGKVFGTLVHAVLQEVALDAGPAAIAAHARVQGRLAGASPEEVDAAAVAVTAALSHPLFERARRAVEVRREWPLILPLEDGRLLEGVIDLAFKEEAAWTLVDFKTDADLDIRRAHYDDQLRWYALAVTRITASPVRAVILAV
jgi:ATP-dependent helicase/nuclease subunit A